MSLLRVKCSKFNATTFPGYRKGAYGIPTSYGTSFKNLNYVSKFGVVMHQNMEDKKDILVEVFQLLNGGWLDKTSTVVPIPYETLKKLTVGTNFHDKVVGRNGHAFISGFAHDVNEDIVRPSCKMYFNSNAWKFFRDYGVALSIALKYPDSIHDLNEGIEFDEKVRDIIDFDDEMRGVGINACGIENVKERIRNIQEQMEKDDKETSESHRQFSEAVEILERYGIKYKKRKAA